MKTCPTCYAAGLHESWCPDARSVRQGRLALLLMLLILTLLLVPIIEAGDFWDTAGWLP